MLPIQCTCDESGFQTFYWSEGGESLGPADLEVCEVRMTGKFQGLEWLCSNSKNNLCSPFGVPVMNLEFRSSSGPKLNLENKPVVRCGESEWLNFSEPGNKSGPFCVVDNQCEDSSSEPENVSVSEREVDKETEIIS